MRHAKKRGRALAKVLALAVAIICAAAAAPKAAKLVAASKQVQIGVTSARPAVSQENTHSDKEVPLQGSITDFASLLPEVTQPAAPEAAPAGAKPVKTINLSPTSGIVFGNGRIKNNSDLSNATVSDILKTKSDIKVELNSDKPQVLIIHTHTTECYHTYDTGYYMADTATRTKDETKNMVRVGQEIAKVLNAAGINTVQDTQIHDLSYNEAYSKSRASAKEYLKKYPSIKIVLDVHRDSITYDDGTRAKPTVTINGQKAAQMMIIVGCDGKKTPIPNYRQNLRFGAALNSAIEQKYPGLMRSLLFRYSFYNQDLTTGSILVEMGSVANTLSEAVYSGKLLGSAMADYLKSL